MRCRAASTSRMPAACRRRRACRAAATARARCCSSRSPCWALSRFALARSTPLACGSLRARCARWLDRLRSPAARCARAARACSMNSARLWLAARALRALAMRAGGRSRRSSSGRGRRRRRSRD
jgi:hypothetical protein